jgi:hypothetical protein
MSADLVGSKWLASKQARGRLLSTIGLCELILNLGVPVLQEYALAMIRSSEGFLPYESGDFYNSAIALRAKREMKLFHLKHVAKLNPSPIAYCARVSFAKAFGISIDQQLIYESQLASWEIELEGDVQFHDAPRRTDTWEETRSWFPERYP